MKKLFSVLLVLLLLTSFASQEAGYIVNERSLYDMDVKELYALEDAVIDALRMNTERELATFSGVYTFVLNPRSKKYHYPYCYSAVQIGEQRIVRQCTVAWLEQNRYSPCRQCNPISIDY